MTVEASVVLPLFLFFFLNLSCAIELIRLHGNLEFALCDIGNRMAVYGYALTNQENEEIAADGELWEELKDFAVSYTFVKNEIVCYVGENNLRDGPIAEGKDGLQFLESEIFDTDDCVEIVVTYKVSPFADIAGFGSFRMSNRYYGHVWNGYRIPEAEIEQSTDVVYVAENGVVYHEDSGCSFLLLSVRSVSLTEAYESRNIAGGRYTPCMRCYEEDSHPQTVYITADGESIHCREDCGSLRRTVYVLPSEEIGRYRACSRCAQS
uniref:hypothetical protein n=1 Tax=Acetatifactor sp. TaxID=1872090 RepID=UPI00405604AE